MEIDAFAITIIGTIGLPILFAVVRGYFSITQGLTKVQTQLDAQEKNLVDIRITHDKFAAELKLIQLDAAKESQKIYNHVTTLFEELKTERR
jgi:uncharacterized membrane-anchored protein YhcB (DUF1043 family)